MIQKCLEIANLSAFKLCLWLFKQVREDELQGGVSTISKKGKVTKGT